MIDEKNCPTIIYVSRTRRAEEIARRLCDDGYEARPYHGQLDKQVKTDNQNAFIKGDVRIMVATSAFGMGVDKKDVGMVIHYDISDSLENYVQEAGRAGRDESILADCYVLFNDEDLNKHFILLNQTKLSIQEIQQIWKAIKSVTKMRSRISQSALELARKAGWDENIHELETKVRTAICALEESGYVKRGQNVPRVFANSITARNVQEAIRIIKKLIASRSRSYAGTEEPESRVDYIADHLGIEKEKVIHIVNMLREAGILADAKDLTAYIKTKANMNHSLNILNEYKKIEDFLLTVFSDEEKTFNIKELNEQAEAYGCTVVTPYKLKTITNFWTISKWIKRQMLPPNHLTALLMYRRESLKEKLIKRFELAKFILEYLYAKVHDSQQAVNNQIRKTMTREKFSQLFGELSPSQLNIINDGISKYIVVAAGPGSGKTRVLVHKLASLLLMEDVKHEQLLMLTFSRSAATEFKKRLLKLYSNSNGQAVLKFSKQGMEKIQSFREKNYVPESAKIRFMVFWKKENAENETNIILPEMFFKKQETS